MTTVYRHRALFDDLVTLAHAGCIAAGVGALTFGMETR
jgi:hypothetical protein